eukprot:8827343-Pyramimonas_sp.AAC.1
MINLRTQTGGTRMLYLAIPKSAASFANETPPTPSHAHTCCSHVGSTVTTALPTPQRRISGRIDRA